MGRFERLIELNKNMDAIIKVARMETETMEYEIQMKCTDALTDLWNCIKECIPAFKQLNGWRTVEKSFIGTTVSIRVNGLGTFEMYFNSWDTSISNTNLEPKYKYNGSSKEEKERYTLLFIAKNLSELKQFIYDSTEQMFIGSIETKARKQMEYQDYLLKTLSEI